MTKKCKPTRHSLPHAAIENLLMHDLHEIKNDYMAKYVGEDTHAFWLVNSLPKLVSRSSSASHSSLLLHSAATGYQLRSRR